MSAPNRHQQAGLLGAYAKWAATTDRAAATEAARRAAADRFLREVREEHPGLDQKTAVKMAEARRRLYFARLSRKGAEARRAQAARARTAPDTDRRAA